MFANASIVYKSLSIVSSGLALVSTPAIANFRNELLQGFSARCRAGFATRSQRAKAKSVWPNLCIVPLGSIWRNGVSSSMDTHRLVGLIRVGVDIGRRPSVACTFAFKILAG